MADLLDRCSSPPPLTIDTFENEIRACLMDLCQRVSLMFDEPLPSSSTLVYNPIPSPVFKRKSEEQSAGNRRNRGATNNQLDEQSTKKKRNRSSTKKTETPVTTNVVVVIPPGRREEPVEQESPDIKPTVVISSDYVCEWDNCRK